MYHSLAVHCWHEYSFILPPFACLIGWTKQSWSAPSSIVLLRGKTTYIYHSYFADIPNTLQSGISIYKFLFLIQVQVTVSWLTKLIAGIIDPRKLLTSILVLFWKTFLEFCWFTYHQRPITSKLCTRSHLSKFDHGWQYTCLNCINSLDHIQKIFKRMFLCPSCFHILNQVQKLL